MTIEKIKKQLERIKNSDFEINTTYFFCGEEQYCKILKDAWICVNNIDSVNNATKEEKKNLHRKLDAIMMEKYKDINPNFSEKTIKRLINTYYRGIIIFPMDILVIDDEMFRKVGMLDDYGSINSIKVLMAKDKSLYYDVFDEEFSDSDDSFLLNPIFETRGKDDIKNIAKFISDEINRISGYDVAEPTYEIETREGKSHMHEDSLSRKSYGINIYLNTDFYNIVKILLEKSECEIKMLVQSGEDISLYYLHQSFANDKPSWKIIDVKREVWKLSETILNIKKQAHTKKRINY